MVVTSRRGDPDDRRARPGGAGTPAPPLLVDTVEDPVHLIGSQQELVQAGDGRTA